MHSFRKHRFVSHALMIAGTVVIANTTAMLAFAAESGLADPTRPSGFSERAVTPTNPSEKLTLTLIRLGAKPHAIINGETVEPGQSIAGYRLLSLQTTSAILSGPNGRTVLQLAPTIRKSSSTYSVQNR